MIDITITVKCPDLTLAASAIAAALNHKTPANCQTFGDLPPAATPAKPTAARSAAEPARTSPVPTASHFSPPAAAVPAQTPQASAPPAAPVAPVAAAPSFTREQIGKAGADMLAANPAKMPELMALLQQFDAPAVTELKPEQLGAFATALRGLGAKI